MDPLGPTTCTDLAPSRETASQNTGLLYLSRRAFSLDAIKKKNRFQTKYGVLICNQLSLRRQRQIQGPPGLCVLCVSCRRAAESRSFRCTYKQLPNLQASPRRPSLNVAHLLVWVCFRPQSTLSRPDVYPELCVHHSCVCVCVCLGKHLTHLVHRPSICREKWALSDRDGHVCICRIPLAPEASTISFILNLRKPI